MRDSPNLVPKSRSWRTTADPGVISSNRTKKYCVVNSLGENSEFHCKTAVKL